MLQSQRNYKFPQKVHEQQEKPEARDPPKGVWRCDGEMKSTGRPLWKNFITKVYLKKSPEHLQRASSALVWSGRVWLVLAQSTLAAH